jgi:iron only hydrogenase large subunit-like protein
MDFFHSVRLEDEKCKGCTNCIKRCPTEAIRVRDGKAVILEERCIDCGECIRVCPNNAKTAQSDSLELLKQYEYNIALPAPSLFGQFKNDVSPSQILQAFKTIGFNAVYEVARAADYITCAMSNFLKSNPGTTWISTSCPAAVRLIQVRFPDLLSQLMPIESPMELAALLAREEAIARTGLQGEAIGTFFITPCPAKTTAVHQPVGSQTNVSGTLSMTEIYGALLKAVSAVTRVTQESNASRMGLGWAMAGGERVALGGINHLAADGIHEVVSMLEELEMGHLEGVDFIEVQSCPGGCLGGPLTIANSFVAQARLQRMALSMKGSRITSCDHISEKVYIAQQIEPRSILTLDSDMPRAIQMIEEIESLTESLPGLDCSACGAPSCRALAEDIVRGLASESDCIIKLREQVQRLAEEMVGLSAKLPPTMGRGGQQNDKA